MIVVCNEGEEKYKDLIYILDVKLIKLGDLIVEVEGQGRTKYNL